MSRVRTEASSASPVTVTIRNKVPDNPNWDYPTRMKDTAPSTTTYVPSSYEKVFTDEVVPDFFRRRSRGEIFVNPMSVVETRWTRTPSSHDGSRLTSFRYLKSGYPYRMGICSTGWTWNGLTPPENNLPVSKFLSPPSLTNVQDLAVTASWAKANEQDVQGLVILAEGEKTIRSFMSIGWRLIKILRALRRWDVKWLQRQLTPKELADRWMEGRYAIRPVVYDAMDCVKAARRNLTQNPERRTYRSGASDSGEVSDIAVTSAGANDFTHYGSRSTIRSVSARAGVLAAIDEVTLATSWGLNQPFTALWELVPFSFVVDWFFNVGKTIASWSPMYGIRALASWVVVVDTITQSLANHHTVDQYSHDDGYGYFDRHIVISGGMVSKTVSTKLRVATPKMPILPTFKVSLDWAKFLDLAIMAKRFR